MLVVLGLRPLFTAFLLKRTHIIIITNGIDALTVYYFLGLQEMSLVNRILFILSFTSFFPIPYINCNFNESYCPLDYSIVWSSPMTRCFLYNQKGHNRKKVK